MSVPLTATSQGDDTEGESYTMTIYHKTLWQRIKEHPLPYISLLIIAICAILAIVWSAQYAKYLLVYPKAFQRGLARKCTDFLISTWAVLLVPGANIICTALLGVNMSKWRQLARASKGGGGAGPAGVKSGAGPAGVKSGAGPSGRNPGGNPGAGAAGGK